MTRGDITAESVGRGSSCSHTPLRAPHRPRPEEYLCSNNETAGGRANSEPKIAADFSGACRFAHTRATRSKTRKTPAAKKIVLTDHKRSTKPAPHTPPPPGSFGALLSAPSSTTQPHGATHAHPTHTPLLPSSAVHCSTCLPLVCLWLSLQSLKGCPSSSQVSEVWGGPVVATILARLLRRPSVCRCTAIVATHTHTLTAPSLSSSFHHLCCAAAPVCVPTQ